MMLIFFLGQGQGDVYFTKTLYTSRVYIYMYSTSAGLNMKMISVCIWTVFLSMHHITELHASIRCIRDRI